MRFEVKFNQTSQRLPIAFRSNIQHLPIEFQSSRQGFEVFFEGLQTITVTPENLRYDGSYEATPAVYAQILPTSKKYLVDDVTVKKIPFYNVSNTSGGNTVFIGKEI